MLSDPEGPTTAAGVCTGSACGVARRTSGGAKPVQATGRVGESRAEWRRAFEPLKEVTGEGMGLGFCVF